MNKNILTLLENMGEDKGKFVNNLIEVGVFTQDYIVEKAIESRSPRIICNVAFYIKNLNNINIKKLSNVIITYMDMDKLADTIIKTGDASYVHKFAKNLENVPIEKLADAIIETDNIFQKEPITEEKPDDIDEEYEQGKSHSKNRV